MTVHWLSNDQFVAVRSGELLQYSPHDIDNPQKLGVKVSSYARMDVSPDKKWIAHLKKDENLYPSALDGSESRLLVEQTSEIDPGFPVWLSSEMLLHTQQIGHPLPVRSRPRSAYPNLTLVPYFLRMKR